MNPFTMLERAGLDPVSPTHLGKVLLELGFALLLGAIIAYRPWRRALGRPLVARETAQAQLLIAVAGAVMVAIIGDSVARAFGLVGLGGFIRFRSGIKDPRDAAVMFLMIGVGMACGLGLVGIAIATSAFVIVVLIGFDIAGAPPAPQRARVSFVVDDARTALPALRLVFPGLRVITAPLGGQAPHELLLEMELSEAADAAAMHERASRGGVGGLLEVGLRDD